MVALDSFSLLHDPGPPWRALSRFEVHVLVNGGGTRLRLFFEAPVRVYFLLLVSLLPHQPRSSK